jgi:hypothetical protein
LKRTVFCLLICLGCFSTAFSQKPTTTHVDAKQAKPAAKPSFLLTVKTRPILNISLKAEKAKVSAVAQELAKRLKIPVQLGKQRESQLLTVEFSELTLEPAMQLLAPQVYVDYEINTGEMMPSS